MIRLTFVEALIIVLSFCMMSCQRSKHIDVTSLYASTINYCLEKECNTLFAVALDTSERTIIKEVKQNVVYSTNWYEISPSTLAELSRKLNKNAVIGCIETSSVSKIIQDQETISYYPVDLDTIANYIPFELENVRKGRTGVLHFVSPICLVEQDKSITGFITGLKFNNSEQFFLIETQGDRVSRITEVP